MHIKVSQHLLMLRYCGPSWRFMLLSAVLLSPASPECFCRPTVSPARSNSVMGCWTLVARGDSRNSMLSCLLEGPCAVMCCHMLRQHAEPSRCGPHDWRKQRWVCCCCCSWPVSCCHRHRWRRLYQVGQWCSNIEALAVCSDRMTCQMMQQGGFCGPTAGQ